MLCGRKPEELVQGFVGVLVCSGSREVIVTVGVHAIVSVFCWSDALIVVNKQT